MSLQDNAIICIVTRIHMFHYILGEKKESLYPGHTPASIVRMTHHFGLKEKDSTQVNQNFLWNLFKRSLIYFWNIYKRKRWDLKLATYFLIIKVEHYIVCAFMSFLWFVCSWHLPIFLLWCLSFFGLLRVFNVTNSDMAAKHIVNMF